MSKVMINIRVDPLLRDLAKKKAHEAGLSLTQFIVGLLNHGISQPVTEVQQANRLPISEQSGWRANAESLPTGPAPAASHPATHADGPSELTLDQSSRQPTEVTPEERDKNEKEAERIRKLAAEKRRVAGSKDIPF